MGLGKGRVRGMGGRGGGQGLLKVESMGKGGVMMGERGMGGGRVEGE